MIDVKVNPPKQTKAEMLKKVGVDIDRETFEKYLNKICYRLEDRGCDHYIIVNNRGENTIFWVYGKSEFRLEINDSKMAFGKNSGGAFVFYLKDARIKLLNGGALIVDGGPSSAGFHVGFYNHDDPLTKKEEYIARLPLDYVVKMRCGDCKYIMNTTHKISGVYLILQSFMIGMVSPFNSPRCKKCEQRTYSDIGFNFDNFIYSVKTNRMVSRDWRTALEIIEKKHAAEMAEYKKIEGPGIR